MKLLINKNDFKGYRQVSNGVSLDKIEQYIFEAQTMDLKALLCDDFYYDILKNYQSADYQKLIHGDSYTDEDIEKETEGLKAVLAYFAYARYIIEGDVTDTPAGLLIKSIEGTTPVSMAQRRTIASTARKNANEMWNQVRDYLDVKYQEGKFEKYKECCEDTPIKMSVI